MAVLIVAASVFGSVAAWQASSFSAKASDLDGLATQQLAQRQQIQGYYQGLVSQDVRLFGRFKQHTEQANLLNDEASRTADPQLAAGLHAQAKGELALARTLQGFFSFRPTVDGQGNASYDRTSALVSLESLDPQLPGLRPDETLKRADAVHQTTIHLVGITALFIAALFFLTLAQLAKRATRDVFLVAGIAVIAVGAVLFVLVRAAA